MKCSKAPVLAYMCLVCLSQIGSPATPMLSCVRIQSQVVTTPTQMYVNVDYCENAAVLLLPDISELKQKIKLNTISRSTTWEQQHVMLHSPQVSPKLCTHVELPVTFYISRGFAAIGTVSLSGIQQMCVLQG